MRNKFLFALCLTLTLSACVSNTINVRPSPQEYQQLNASPVYIKKASNKDLDTYSNELNECIKTSNIKANRSSKVGIGFGSYFALGRLITIATASGPFAPIYVAAGTAGSILGGSTIYATKATRI
tara:strand:+ start:312 stop:686 length:375 start_codon:yes stop_codon:yes gene_type:complete